MPKFSASIEYNSDTIMELSSAINNTFKIGFKAIYLVICIALIAIGSIIGFHSLVGIVCIAIGCFLLPSINANEKRQAREQIKQMNGHTLHVDYCFHDSHFICFDAKERNKFPYNSIIRLVKNVDYYYMFPNVSQAYMIDRSTIQPADMNKFENFISDKVGLQWTQKISLLTFSLKKWRFNKANTRAVR